MNLRITQYTLLFILLLTASASSASNHRVLSPLPIELKEIWSDFSLVGQTTFRRFGFHIYDCSLWTTGNKPYDSIANEILIDDAYALSITYTRNISLQQLLSSTKNEWQRLGFSDQYPLTAWLTMLKNIWPSIEKGDQLIAVVTAEGKTKFFNRDSSLGTIDDENFGPAFLSIWLGEEARYQKKRKELLGE
jgi:hypothetical protein